MIWAETERYVGKILHINAGQRLSRQYHNKKDETFLVQQGEMDLEIGQGDTLKTLRLGPLQSFHCAPLTVHRMVAVSDVDVVEERSLAAEEPLVAETDTRLGHDVVAGVDEPLLLARLDVADDVGLARLQGAEPDAVLLHGDDRDRGEVRLALGDCPL